MRFGVDNRPPGPPPSASALHAFAYAVEVLPDPQSASTQSSTQVVLGVALESATGFAWTGGVSQAHVIIDQTRHELQTSAFAVGVFELPAATARTLTLRPGASLAFGFTWQAPDGRSVNILVPLTLPAQRATPEAEVSLGHLSLEPLDLLWWPAPQGAAIAVRRATEPGRPGAVTWQTFALQQPADLPQALDVLRSLAAGAATIPATAFPTSGTYRIELTNLQVVDAQSGGLPPTLGAKSFFLAGLTTALELQVR